MEFQVSKSIPLPITAGAGLLAAGFTAWGFHVDPTGFGPNALAEAAGVALSVFIAILIVDRALDRHRARQWAVVAEATGRTVQAALVRAGTELYTRLPAPRPHAADPYLAHVVGSARVEAALTQLAAEYTTVDIRTVADVDSIKQALETPFDLLREAAMPRVLSLGRQELAEALADVEEQFQSLVHAEWVMSRGGGSRRVGDAIPAVVNAMATASAVFAAAV